MRRTPFYILLAAFVLCCAQGNAQSERVVAFYNVENLFDTENDPATRDEDMLPLADREWSRERYEKKIEDLGNVVWEMAKEYDYPALLALAEVENRTVMEDLLSHERLVGQGYEICHYDSADERGIDVGLLFRKDLFLLERSVAVKADTSSPTRDLLAVWGELCGVPVFIVVAHLPSRIAGVKFTQKERIAVAQKICSLVDSVRRESPHRRVMIMGDMNDNPNDYSLKSVLGAGRNAERAMLINPFFRPWGKGSSVYRGKWNRYDTIILSPDFFFSSNLRVKSRRGRCGYVFAPKFLLDRHGFPLPTYRGVEYYGGVSDHLPVYLLLSN